MDPTRACTLFLDLDDVLCLGTPYSGLELLLDPGQRPPDLFERLFEGRCVAALLEVMEDFKPAVVLTSDWLRLMERPALEALLCRTRLGAVAEGLHSSCEAPTNAGSSRLAAIEYWLQKHHRGEPFVVIDDLASGTGLLGSYMEKQGRVVLCEPGVGLTRSAIPKISKALTTPCKTKKGRGA